MKRFLIAGTVVTAAFTLLQPMSLIFRNTKGTVTAFFFVLINGCLVPLCAVHYYYLKQANLLFLKMSAAAEKASEFSSHAKLGLYKFYSVAIFGALCSTTIILNAYAIFQFIDLCDGMRIAMTIGHILLYVVSWLMAMYMASMMFYVIAYMNLLERINTDSTFTIVAHVFNRRRQERRIRGAQSKAMEAQDFNKLYYEMERNEVLTLMHRFPLEKKRVEDTFLAYYQIRKQSDIWKENNGPTKDGERPKPSDGEEDDVAGRSDTNTASVQPKLDLNGTQNIVDGEEKDEKAVATESSDDTLKKMHEGKLAFVQERSVPMDLDSIEKFMQNEFFLFSLRDPRYWAEPR